MIARCSTFFVIASETALGLWITVEELDDLLQLACNNLSAMSN